MMPHFLIWESAENELVGVKGEAQKFAVQCFATAWLLPMRFPLDKALCYKFASGEGLST